MGVREETHSRQTSAAQATDERGVPYAATPNANETPEGGCGLLI